MSVQLNKDKKVGVLNSPTMTGGQGFIVLSAAGEDVDVRVIIWEDGKTEPISHKVYRVKYHDGATRAGEVVGFHQSKVSFYLDGDYEGPAVVDCAIIPSRPFS